MIFVESSGVLFGGVDRVAGLGRTRWRQCEGGDGAVGGNGLKNDTKT